MGKKGILPILKWNDSRDFQCLGHSNWTICELYGYLCSKKISFFFTFILGSQFLLPQRANNGKSGILPNSKLDQGLSKLGAFKQFSNGTICSPFRPLRFEIFPSFSFSYWGTISYFPRQINGNVARAPSVNRVLRCVGRLCLITGFDVAS